jgi:hypothetical protein
MGPLGPRRTWRLFLLSASAEHNSCECCRPSARAGDGRWPPGLEITGFGSKFGRIGLKSGRMGR